MNRVLSDGDAVAVVELLFLDRLAVDKRAVGAPEVDDPELLTAPFDAGVMPAGGGIAEDEVVVRRASEPKCGVTSAVSVACIRA